MARHPGVDEGLFRRPEQTRRTARPTGNSLAIAEFSGKARVCLIVSHDSKGIAIAVRPDEFPAGYTMNAMLDVKNIERQSILRLSCADGVGENAALHIGEQTATWNLQQVAGIAKP